MATMSEIFALFDGWLQSTNYGNIMAGEYKYIAPGGSEPNNDWYEKGTPIISDSVPCTKEFDIIFNEHKFIRVSIAMEVGILGMWSGQFSFSWRAYLDGQPYKYESGGYEYGIGSTVGGSMAGDGAGTYPWTISGFTLQFNKETTTPLLTNSQYSVGMMLIPNVYEAGAHYPFAVPFEPYEEYTLSAIRANVGWYDIDDDNLQCDALVDYFSDIITAEVEYDAGDNIPTGGGGGSYMDRNDAMALPSLPTLGALATGMVKLYAPTASQMLSISAWLWSSNFFDNIIKNFSSPLDNIIGLYISPITPSTASDTFKIGNLDSEIPINKVGAEYLSKSLGRLNVKKYYNSFADYDNYRNFKLFLPYYGIVDISSDDFVGGYIEVAYHINFFCGAATIFVITTRNGTPHILHQYSTNIFTSIPFSGVNMMSYYTQMAGASAALASATVSGNITGMTAGVTGLLSAHPNYGGSKSMSAMGGLMGIQYPYLIECRSIRDMPPSYNKYNGIPLNHTQKVSTLSGYTEFESIRISAAGASSQELNEIERIMKEGVIL